MKRDEFFQLVSDSNRTNKMLGHFSLELSVDPVESSDGHDMNPAFLQYFKRSQNESSANFTPINPDVSPVCYVLDPCNLCTHGRVAYTENSTALGHR